MVLAGEAHEAETAHKVPSRGWQVDYLLLHHGVGHDLPLGRGWCDREAVLVVKVGCQLVLPLESGLAEFTLVGTDVAVGGLVPLEVIPLREHLATYLATVVWLRFSFHVTLEVLLEGELADKSEVTGRAVQKHSAEVQTISLDDS